MPDRAVPEYLLTARYLWPCASIHQAEAGNPAGPESSGCRISATRLRIQRFAGYAEDPDGSVREELMSTQKEQLALFVAIIVYVSLLEDREKSCEPRRRFSRARSAPAGPTTTPCTGSPMSPSMSKTQLPWLKRQAMVMTRQGVQSSNPAREGPSGSYGSDPIEFSHPRRKRQ